MTKTICTVLMLLVCTDVLRANYKSEKAILKKILSNYDAEVRPESENRKYMVVRFDMKLKNIVSLDIKEQVLKINAFTILRWNDPQLRWNKKKYNNTNYVNIGRKRIWTPDVVLYNTADEKSRLHTDIYTSKCLVYSNGKVIMRNLVTWKVSCSFDITWFPVDKQMCNISFGSWSYSKWQLRVLFFKQPKSKKELFSSNFRVDSGEWVINKLRSYKKDIRFACCPEPFSSVTYEIVVSRQSLYYFMYILLPLISQAFLFLLVFLIPADSGERMGFGVTILLSITVYLLVISEKLPEKSDDTPMLGLCFILIFYVLSTALGFVTATTVLSQRSTRPPHWLVKLAKIGCSKKKEVPFQGSVHGRLLSDETMGNRNDKRNNDDTHDYETTFQEPPKNPPCQSPSQTEDYSADWKKVCHDLDKKLFIIYIIIIALIPVLVTLPLPKRNLGNPR